jgi:hypothetical protein
MGATFRFAAGFRPTPRKNCVRSETLQPQIQTCGLTLQSTEKSRGYRFGIGDELVADQGDACEDRNDAEPLPARHALA